jgi:hypothetical protein
MVLRRQLAQDLPRDRPWIATRHRTRWLVVTRRDIRSFLRFPSGRLGRLILMAVAAGLALRAAWHGNSIMIVVGAAALYLAALDVVEPLAQQVDQAERTEQLPIEEGVLLLRHLPVPAIVMVILGGIGWGAAMAVERSSDALALGAVFIVPAVLGALAGAVSSVVMGAPSPTGDGALLPPEVAGMRIAFRTAWPLIVATIGCLPVVIASKALGRGDDPYGTALNVIGFVLLPVAGTVAWVRYRVPAKLWWRRTMEEGQQAQRDRTSQKMGTR